MAIWTKATTGGPKPQMRAEAALITRPDFDPVVTALSPDAAACVAALQAGESLGDAVARASPDFDPTATLGALVAGGAFIGLEEPSP